MSISENTATAQSSMEPLALPAAELALIDQLCATAEKREAYWMAEILAKRASDEQLQQPIRAAWRFLASILQMHFRPENASEPFGPMMVLADGRRSITPGDLTLDQIALLQTVLAVSKDCEVQSRAADLIWLKTKDPLLARQAVRAYLASAERVEDPNYWSPCTDRLERAARIARMLGRSDPSLQEVLETILKKVRVYRGRDNLFLTNELIGLLYEFRHGDAVELAQYSLAGAERARSQPDLNRARAHYETTAKLYLRSKDKDAFGRMRQAIAETFREEAEAQERAGNYLAAHVAWTRAIIAFRKSPGGAALVPELQVRLHAAAENSRKQTQGFEQKVDFSQQIEQATASVAGLDRLTALKHFAFGAPVIQVDDLRKGAIEQIRDHPLPSLVPIVHLDKRGRVTGRTPAARLDDPEQHDAAVLATMIRNAGFHRWYVFQGWLRPAFYKLTEEHSLTEAALTKVIGHCGMIPPGREEFFVRGLAAGFREDFAVALCMLVPQIENCLRWVLHNLGTIPGSIDDDGIEEDWPLQRCLSHEKVQEFLGKDLVFELRSLLIEKAGPNLRNLLAHGLLAARDCYSIEGFYVWWLILKVVLATSPAVREHAANGGQGDRQPSSSTDDAAADTE